MAQTAGFDYVDLKHCHGYLGHEFLSAVDRPGCYGGSFENRTRFLKNLVVVVRSSAPNLGLSVRLSTFDFVPFAPAVDRVGQPAPIVGMYRFAFGGDGTGVGIDLTEPHQLMELLSSLGIPLVCLAAGSPY
ncbi:MAG: hypothetical protein JNL67_11745 [Planctomycetaceae bacterium]|nr:hypothetical protein [Planctomycetaceae bacterium]